MFLKKNRLEYTGLLIIFISIPILFFAVRSGLNKLRLDNKLTIQENYTRELSAQIDAYVFNKVIGITQALATIQEVLDQQLDNKEYDRHETLIALRTTKALFNASIVYVMDQEGTVIACTPYGADNSTLTGKNYAFRPYFKGAMAGKNVIYLALGTTTSERGIYFSSPVFSKDSQETPVGVVIIKIGLTEIDKIVNEPEHPTALLSPEGIVFAANRPKWLFHAAMPLSATELAQLKASKRFADEPLTPLDFTLDSDRVTISGASHTVVRYPIYVTNWDIVTVEPEDVNFELKPIHIVLVSGALGLISFLTVLVILLIINIIKRKSAEEKTIQLAESFKRFVPEQFLNFLNKKSILEIQLGDQTQQEMTVQFVDIRGFTALSEKMTPRENFEFINGFLHEMEPVIIASQGVIDKYIGDAIMSLYSSPVLAMKASINMLETLKAYNARRQEHNKPAIRIGIGLNFGLVMLGTIGGKTRMDSTVISDAVNLTSRVEGLTKNYNVSLLASEQVISRLENPDQFCLRKIDKVQVKGKSEKVVVYEIFDADPPEVKEQKIASMSLFNQAYNSFYAGEMDEAQKIFQQCYEQNPQDTVTEVYLSRCRKENKSAPDW